ncbi:MAG: response regulator receiver modulated diguanylate cyclase/phosphodiesterase with sensor(s) [Bryobacterales bacterium]|nr:response regulator receiver modulated diguanylate cyclase/phosphodiesterase with sensor(s) [Bryobacterales bacterium]
MFQRTVVLKNVEPTREFERLILALSCVEAARIVPEAVRLLREEAGASEAMVVRQTDARGVATLWADPPDASSTMPSVFGEALPAGEIVVLERVGTGRFDPILSASEARAAAILPISSGPAFTLATVLLWRHEVVFDARLLSFLRTTMVFLRATIPPTEALRTAESQRDEVAAVLETLPQGVAFVDERGARGWLNGQAARVLELPAGSVSPALITEAMQKIQLAAEHAQDREWILRDSDARVLSITSAMTRLRDVDGRLWLFNDITEQRRAEDELRASEDRYRELFDNSPLPAWVSDLRSLAILMVNPAAMKLYGYTREEFLAMKLTDLRPPGEIPKLLANLPNLEKAHEKSGPWLHRKKDGTLLVVEVTTHEVGFSGIRARLAMIYDVTERNAAEQRLREQEERWQLALRGNNDGLWDYDITKGEVYFSRRWKEMLGYQEHELGNLTEEWEKRVHPDDLPGVQAKLADHLSRKTPFYVAEYRLRCKDGNYKWVLGRGQAVWDENGKPVRMVGSHTDITERKQSEERLTREAVYDSLTGLFNRRYLLEELERVILRAEDQGFPLALALGDLDHFKSVNDTHGHAGGDEVLAVFGQILQQCQNAGDIAGRIGGDEFCMVFPRASAAEADISVERTRARLSTMAFGVSSGVPFSVSATFGLATWHPGETGKELLEAADRALYQAKQLGRNRVLHL